MEQRVFGRTGLQVAVLGLGCGAVGGLMVRGEAADQERAVARAVEAGITYFDTPAMYGDGQSETNLGRVLARLKPQILVGTKVRLREEDKAGAAAAIAASLEQSLRRLGREQVDLFQLHNPIVERDTPGAVTADFVLEEVVPALERLRAAGKTRFIGITATGDTASLHRVAAAGALHSAQVPYNLLNPSPGGAMPDGYPAQDYGNLLAAMERVGMAGIGIRVLAGGALSGSRDRHPVASPPPEPIGSASSFERDQERGRHFAALVREGYAGSLAEAALRYAISHPVIAPALIGVASLDQLEQAIAAAENGPLPEPALRRAAEIQRGFAGEAR